MAALIAIFVVAPLTMFLSYQIFMSFNADWKRFVLALAGFGLLAGSIVSGFNMMQHDIGLVRATQIILFVFVEVLGWGMLLGIYVFGKKVGKE